MHQASEALFAGEPAPLSGDHARSHRLARLVRRGALCTATALAALSSVAAAAADLMLHPTRVVFERNQRAAQVELVNNGKRTLTYRIALVERRMNENGEFIAAEPPLPDERFASPMLRHSPRQVMLAPGASQTVRIMVRKPADLAAGEYRSHLQFTQVADDEAQRGASGAAEHGLSIRLVPLIGASIPVIVRHGASTATATLSAARFESAAPGGVPALAFDMHREGNRSLYGDLLVNFTPEGGGAAKTIARANGVAVYAPNAVRHVRISLPPMTGSAAGTLQIVYRERADGGGRLLAQTKLALH